MVLESCDAIALWSNGPMVLGSGSLRVPIVLGLGFLGSNSAEDDTCCDLVLPGICTQVGFRKGGVQFLGRRTQLEVLLAVLLLVVILALLACLLLLGLGTSFGEETISNCQL